MRSISAINLPTNLHEPYVKFDYLSRMNRIALLLTALLLTHFSLSAQSYGKPDHDTTYYHSYKGTIIGRVYLSRNYMQIRMNPPGSLPTMKYHANTPLSIGLGFTYKFVSFSLSKGLNFLESNATKGATHSTDLQLHIYKRKWTLDAIGQFYRGYYLSPHGLASPDGHTYYIRPDVGVQLVGVAGYRVMNDERFTYGAGLSQNAWQEKSAGSLLLGGQAFYLALNGDSALVPRKVDSVYNEKNIRKLHLLEFGPGIGYAYTFVIQKHYFLLGSLNANIDLYLSQELGSGVRGNKIGFTPNYMLRLGGGYTTNRWGLNLIWIMSNSVADGKASGYQYAINTGNYRLVYARRFAVNRRMKRILGPDIN